MCDNCKKLECTIQEYNAYIGVLEEGIAQQKKIIEHLTKTLTDINVTFEALNLQWYANKPHIKDN